MGRPALYFWLVTPSYTIYTDAGKQLCVSVHGTIMYSRCDSGNIKAGRGMEVRSSRTHVRLKLSWDHLNLVVPSLRFSCDQQGDH